VLLGTRWELDVNTLGASNSKKSQNLEAFSLRGEKIGPLGCWEFMFIIVLMA